MGKTAKELSNKPGILIRSDHVKLAGCTIGMVNQTAGKAYRVFLANADIQMNIFSIQFSHGLRKRKRDSIR